MSDLQEVARRDQSVSSLPPAPQVIGHPSPIISHITRTRGNSSCSHVPVGYFDKEGVSQLRRTLTHLNETVGGPGAVLSESSETLSVPADGSFDFEKTLRTIMKLRDRAGIQSRELGVMFRDLRVVGLGAAASYQPTFGSFFNPKVILEKIRAFRHPPLRDILSGFEGVIRPGEMLLVLGSPGSGCSTLLKTLTNQRAEYHLVEGDVHYDSLTPEYIAKHHRGDVVYSSEDDIHFPTLTVDETLRFAAKMRAPHNRMGRPRGDYVKTLTDMSETIFGLRHVKNTPVGDAAIRGVSGGEKKRVSISEALTLRSRISAWDNSTRGLDSSTALEFVRALRIATDVAHISTIVSIYQAAESLYQHFDKVCVLYEGRMAYFGRADQARQYFIDLGFEPAHRQTTPDFLVAVTNPFARTVREDFKGPAPQTAAEFASAFLASEFSEANRMDMNAYFEECVGRPERVLAYKQSAVAEHATTQRKGSPYTISIPMQARAVMLRRLQILRGNLTTQLIVLMTFIIQALINGSVFFRLKDETAEYFSRGGILFFSLLWAALSSIAEIPALFAQRPIVVKHAKAAMYHPFIEAAALTIVDVPITFFTIMIFSLILYFMVGLQASASQFFTFFLFIFTMALVMKAWFRCVAAAFGDPAPAQTVAGIMLLLLVLYTGYAIPKPSMIGALRWISYINPIRYGFEGLISNEFHTLDGTCSNLIPSGAGYETVSLTNQVCGTVGSITGQSTVNGNRFIAISFDYSYSHIWRNYGIIIGFGIAFVAALLFFTEYNTSLSGESSTMLFKRGTKAPVVREIQEKADVVDEEKGNSGSRDATDKMRSETTSVDVAVPPMSDVFTWRHLQYDVRIGKGETRRLLEDVSGYVAPGKLTALMGESGAGKTTLLNVLAERQAAGVVGGERLVNGYPLPSDFQAQTGYVQQMDTHLAQSTVREALLFSAKLRQPPAVPLKEKEAYVDTVLKMCGLEKYADAIVGSLGVEHRKRTTIGVELAAKPKLLLFLDEPTSGLDSQSAWAIVSFLRELANHGQAILCTIHQPSAELFQEFDKLLLLRKGGQTVYFGDIGTNATTLINYFQSNGGYSCPTDANPAEYILDVIGAGATATTDTDWTSTWKSSSQAKAVDEELNALLEDGRKRHAVDTEQHSEFSTSWIFQVKTLWERDMVRHWRDPTYLMAKLALNIVAGLFIGFTFFKAKDSIQGTQNKIFAVFMSLVVSAPLSNQIQGPFIDTRRVYEIRERPSRMYSWTALITSQILGELPLNIIGSSLFFFIWYWLVGFLSSRAGYSYLMFGIMYPMYYTTFSLWVAAISPSAEIAAQLFSFFFSFVITFNGVLQPYKHLGWWKWMYRTSPYTYLVEGLMGQAIGHSEITCAAVEYVTVSPPSAQTCQQYLGEFISTAGGYITNPSATDNCQFCSYRTTDQFLQTNSNIFWSHHWRNFGFMWIYVGFNIFAIYAMTYIFRIRGPANLFRRRP